jgi:hypothetical protein
MAIYVILSIVVVVVAVLYVIWIDTGAAEDEDNM